jgi:hypothetical protein
MIYAMERFDTIGRIKPSRETAPATAPPPPKATMTPLPLLQCGMKSTFGHWHAALQHELGGTGECPTDYGRPGRSVRSSGRALSRRRRPAKPTRPSKPRSPQLPKSSLGAVRVGGGSAICPGGAPGVGVPGGACASATEGGTTATMATRSTTTAHAVRLQDGNIMGLLSIQVVHLRDGRLHSTVVRSYSRFSPHKKENPVRGQGGTLASHSYGVCVHAAMPSAEPPGLVATGALASRLPQPAPTWPSIAGKPHTNHGSSLELKGGG